MEGRYKKMSKLGVRNIDGYNARVAEAKAKGDKLTRTVHTGYDKETGEAIYENEEVEKVVRHLKSQGTPQYLDAVTASEDEDEDGDPVFDATGMGEPDGGDLYQQAVQVVIRDRKASTSYIQRRLQIGYNRAASLMERMEKEGVIGQANHAGKREILLGEEAAERY